MVPGCSTQAAGTHRFMPTRPHAASDQEHLVFETEITGGAEPLEKPLGLAVSANGDLYVIDGAQDQIRVFAADGSPRATWGEAGAGPGQFQFSSGAAF